MYNYFIYYKYTYQNHVRYTTMSTVFEEEGNTSVSLDTKIRGPEDIKKVEDIIRKRLEEESRDDFIPSRIIVGTLTVMYWKRFEDE